MKMFQKKNLKITVPIIFAAVINAILESLGKGVYHGLKAACKWLFQAPAGSQSRFQTFTDISIKIPEIPLWVVLALLCIVPLGVIIITKAIKKILVKKAVNKDSGDVIVYDRDFIDGIYWEWDDEFVEILDTNCSLIARCPMCRNKFNAYPRMGTGHEEPKVTGFCGHCSYPYHLNERFDIPHSIIRKEIDRRIASGESADAEDRIREMENDFPKQYKEAVANFNAEKNESQPNPGQ